MHCEDKQDSANNFNEGYCPDPMCYERLIFINLNDTINCNYCGQKYSASYLKFISKISLDEAEQLIIRLDMIPQRSGPEWTRINRFSPFFCKLISPVFTNYGINKKWEAKLLTEMSMPAIFDPKLLADRAFAIDEFHLSAPGYGKDESGSIENLQHTLQTIESYSHGSNRLIPLYVSDGGYCLLYSISRALVGREIFWHPLKEAMQLHLKENKDWYQKTLKNFFTDDDWQKMINQEEKEFDTIKGDRLNVQMGMIFALSNMLNRPIILLDSTKSDDKTSEFSVTFIPILKNSGLNKNEEIHKPIVFGWADKDHVRIVPLVAIKGHPVPKLHKNILPKIWVIENAAIGDYIEFDDDQYCEVACGRQNETLGKMIKTMEKVYQKIYGVHPQMLSDFCEDVMEFQLFSSETVENLIEHLEDLSVKYRLFRCMICWRLVEMPELPKEYLRRGGLIYEKMKSFNAELVNFNEYILDPIGYFLYDSQTDSLIPLRIFMHFCPLCTYSENQLRHQTSNGHINYFNGDHTRTPCLKSLCPRKMEHFWEGNIYENSPIPLEFNLVYNEVNIDHKTNLFLNESDQKKNSNIDDLAMEIVESNFSFISRTSDQFKIVIADFTELVLEAVSNLQFSCRFCICQDSLWRLCTFSFFKTLNPNPINLKNFHETEMMKKLSLKFHGRQQNSINEDFNLSNVTLILLSDGRKMLLHKNTIALLELVDKLSHICHVRREDVVAVYNGIPATKLKLSESLYILEDQVFVQLREKIVKPVISDSAKNENEEEITLHDKLYSKFMTMKLSNIYLTLIGSSHFWQFLKSHPNLFKKNGDIYRLIKCSKKQLNDNDHFRLPYFFSTEIFLVYNKEKDHFELCLIEFSHLEINKKIRKQLPFEFSKFLDEPTTFAHGSPNDVIHIIPLCQQFIGGI